MTKQTRFWGRCAIKTPEEIEASPFVYDKELPQPHWREDDTCSHCGGFRPSLAIKAIKEGAVVEPTDKNYKIYIQGVPGRAHTKCYLNHFSEAQAVEFVTLAETHKMNLDHPGRFYSGLCFGVYNDAINKALADLKATVESAGTVANPS